MPRCSPRLWWQLFLETGEGPHNALRRDRVAVRIPVHSTLKEDPGGLLGHVDRGARNVKHVWYDLDWQGGTKGLQKVTIGSGAGHSGKRVRTHVAFPTFHLAALQPGVRDLERMSRIEHVAMDDNVFDVLVVDDEGNAHVRDIRRRKDVTDDCVGRGAGKSAAEGVSHGRGRKAGDGVGESRKEGAEAPEVVDGTREIRQFKGDKLDVVTHAANESSVVAVTHAGFRRILDARMVSRGWHRVLTEQSYANWSTWPYSKRK